MKYHVLCNYSILVKPQFLIQFNSMVFYIEILNEIKSSGRIINLISTMIIFLNNKNSFNRKITIFKINVFDRNNKNWVTHFWLLKINLPIWTVLGVPSYQLLNEMETIICITLSFISYMRTWNINQCVITIKRDKFIYVYNSKFSMHGKQSN